MASSARDERARAARHQRLVRQRARAAGDDRQPRVDVHPVEAELGVELIHGEAERGAELFAVAGIDALDQWHEEAVRLREHVRAELRDQHRQQLPRGRIARLAAEHVGDDRRAVALTGARGDVVLGDRPVGAAGVDRGVVPFELVEELHRAEAEAPVRIGHRDRQQHFLELGARPPRGRHVDRVDLVDALDEDALAPVDDLPAEPQLQIRFADAEAAVEIGIEQHRVREPLLLLEAVVAQRLPRASCRSSGGTNGPPGCGPRPGRTPL